MELRKEIEEAAFWDGQVCLDCFTVFDDVGEDCPECNSGEVAQAKLLISLLTRLDADED